MSKTPYEVRMELLKLSFDILQTPVLETRGTLVGEWHMAKEHNPAVPHPVLPDFPNTEDIIAEAKKLNEFVSNG